MPKQLRQDPSHGRIGNIMAQILSILALPKKVMTGRQVSELIHFLRHSYTDYDSEAFLKLPVGRTAIRDALLRLNSLTR
jgi:hypothetical protein